MRRPPGPATWLEKAAWCLFDFANSSYTTVILTVVYARYFVGVVVDSEHWSGLPADTWWAAAGVLSNLLVITSAPLIGVLADRNACKKRYLLMCTAVCVACTGALALFGPGMVLPALLCVVLATFAFSAGENLVAGFLPELTTPRHMGRLSAAGWTVGYFGGLAALALALFLVNREPSRVSWVPLATAAFFAISALPTFIWLRERAVPSKASGGVVKAAFGDLMQTWRERHRWRDLFLFFRAILFFQGGVYIVISFAGIYAEQDIGMASDDIIVMFMALQFAAALGAFSFGFIQDLVGSRVALAGSLVIWCLAVGIAWWATEPSHIWVAGMLAGAAMGASQSASRALVGIFCPPGREGEWFGLWGLATKASAVFGLTWYGTFMAFTNDRRLAILTTLMLFAVGLALLYRVDVARGQEAARVDPAP